MTEKMPSSVKLGSRPSNSFIRSYSSGVRLWAEITSGVIIARPKDRRVPPVLLPITFLNQLFNRPAQFGWIHAADVFVNDFAFFVVEKRCREIAAPSRIDEIDSGLGIGSVQQIRRHRRLHRTEKLRHRCFDVANVVE